MDVFWSMWRSRTIPCPHGSGRPACETLLIHHEQFKIPENLARFAVRHGMAGFVKKMGPAVNEFVADRRKRISPVRPLPILPAAVPPLSFHCHCRCSSDHRTYKPVPLLPYLRSGHASVRDNCLLGCRMMSGSLCVAAAV